MGFTCCVKNCFTASHHRRGENKGAKMDNGATFHRIPKWKLHESSQVSEVTKRRRMAWLSAIRRSDYDFDNVPEHARVCSRHFHSGKPAMEMLESHPDWAPSLHLGHAEVKSSSVARFDRSIKRRQAALLSNTGYATAPTAPLPGQCVESGRAPSRPNSSTQTDPIRSLSSYDLDDKDSRFYMEIDEFGESRLQVKVNSPDSARDVSIKQEQPEEDISIEDHSHLNQSVESSSLQVEMSSPAVTVSHQLFLMNRNDQCVESSKQVKMSSPAPAETVSIQQEHDRLDLNYKLPVEKRTDCDKCGRIFKTSGALQKHLRTHTGEKYQCDQCGLMLCDINGLIRHQRIHTGEKPYHCVQCGKHFRSGDNLKTHMKHHSGEKPYQCHQCEKGFSTQGNLRTHLRIHTGEKPFICNMCGERFSFSTTLKSHQRDHAGKKRYHCGVCVKSFNTRSELKTHKIIHRGEKPYHCESKVNPTRSCQKTP